MQNVFAQENFEIRNYALALSLAYEMMTADHFNKDVARKDLPVREDLDFWLKILQYVPRLDYVNSQQPEMLQKTIRLLDRELVELDFSALVSYLDDVKKHFGSVRV